MIILFTNYILVLLSYSVCNDVNKDFNLLWKQVGA